LKRIQPTIQIEQQKIHHQGAEMSILANDNKALIVAMDHARTHGVMPGLADPGAVIDTAVEAKADAIMTTFGVVKRYRDRLIGRIPTILRLDGGPSLYREEWMAYTEWYLLNSVEDALFLGVDAVVLNLFLGISVEAQTYRIISKVAAECARVNLPLLVEAIPCQSEHIPDPKAAEAMASACRLAFEHGADLAKTYYTGSPVSFQYVIDNCPLPVLIAGGPKMDSTQEVLQVVDEAMTAGSAGVVFGRNIWQGSNTRGMIAALQHIIHHGGTVREAMGLMEGTRVG
jgi:DhnA family fructose-bisphosphate aldolase class Ia